MTPPIPPGAVVFLRTCPACGNDSTFVGTFAHNTGTDYAIHCASCDATPAAKALARIPRFR